MAAKKKANKSRRVVKRPTARAKRAKAKASKPSSSASSPHAPQTQPLVIQAMAQPDQLIGRYTNLASISHTPREFFLDFLIRHEADTLFVSRIITSPAHAKALHSALGRNIAQYENKNGPIDK